MAKKITDADGNTYVQKKPFYKRIWFWILVVILIGLFAGGMGSSNKQSTSSTSNKTSSSQKAEETVPADYKSALTKANQYSDTMHMSKTAIYDQLTADTGEKFSEEAAKYAVDNMKADWNKNALAKAKEYQKQMSMSPDAIYDQLTAATGEKFTPEQAQYAVDNMNK